VILGLHHALCSHGGWCDCGNIMDGLLEGNVRWFLFVRVLVDQTNAFFRQFCPAVDGHASFGASLDDAWQQDGFIFGLVGNGAHLGDFVEVRFVLSISRSLFSHTRTLHLFAEVWETPQKEFMIVGIAITPLRDTTESPSICLSNE